MTDGRIDIRTDVPGLWCDDITFCQEVCGWQDCPRNKANIRDRSVPHSFSVEIPQDCPKRQERRLSGMPDKEKVIKGLEECAGTGNCTKCQYGKEKQALSCKKLLADALELIKSSRLIHTEHALYTVYERHNGEQNV